MATLSPRAWRQNREASGFLCSLAFVCLASVRDVYLGGLFQRLSPLPVAAAAFVLCSVVFLPIAFVKSPKSLRILLRHPWELFWVNATSALAWIAFFYALRTIEPLLVQILFSGVGPLSVAWIDRLIPGAAPPPVLGRSERLAHLGILAALVLAVVVALGGLSGTGLQPLSVTALGIVLATSAGLSISINTVLCRQLNDRGVDPAALVSVRFLGAIVSATPLALLSHHEFDAFFSTTGLAIVLGASLLLIVFPIYVNQVGISLASPFTVRVVLAIAPVLIFLLQLAEGRLSPSPWSLVSAVVYGVFAAFAVRTRQRAIRLAGQG